MDQRETIPGLDRLSKLSGLVKDVVYLGDRPRVRIWTVSHVLILEKVFNLVENVADWSHGVIVHICYYFFEIVQMTW